MRELGFLIGAFCVFAGVMMMHPLLVRPEQYRIAWAGAALSAIGAALFWWSIP
jgi:hypothetical protein